MCTSTHGRSNIHDLFLLIKFFSISLKDVSMATNCVRLNLKKQTPEFSCINQNKYILLIWTNVKFYCLNENSHSIMKLIQVDTSWYKPN